MSQIKPINGNVFLKRDEEEEQFKGINISEKARVKNFNCTVAFVDNNEVLRVGDRVHAPHYHVNEATIDGDEYVIAKVGDLFAHKEGDAYRPINGNVLVRKCENDHVRDESGNIALYMTDNHIEFTHWVEVIDVADNCRHMKKEHIGLFCIAPEESEKLNRILYSKDFCMHESLIEFLTTGE